MWKIWGQTPKTLGNLVISGFNGFAAVVVQSDPKRHSKHGDRLRCPFVELLELMGCPLVLPVYRKTRL